MSTITVLLIICLFILIILSGFLSGSETALTATSKPRILLKFKKGNKRAGYVLKILNNLDNVISSLLLSNNLVNILAKIFTKLFDNNSEDITLSRLLRILRTYPALLFPFLNFKSIRGLEVAVNAVSEPDRNPDKIININKQIISNTVIVDIYLRVFLILSKFKLLLKKADPIFLIRIKLIFLLSFFLSFSIILKIFSSNILLSDISKLFNLK